MQQLKVHNLFAHLVSFRANILSFRWLGMIGLGTAVILFELYEHSLHDGPSSSQFLVEVLFYGLLLPLMGGTLLTILSHVNLKHSQAVHHLDLTQKLSHGLSLAQDWEDVQTILLSFPANIAPFSAVFLLLYDPSQHQLETVKSWQKDIAEQFTYPSQFLAPDPSFLQLDNKLHDLVTHHYPYVHWPETSNGYCLRLFHGDLLVAILHLFLSADCFLDEEQRTILTSLAAPMAVAIDGLHPAGSAVIRATAAEMESRRLTRYLHDMIGQNVGYLVMQLEQMQLNDEIADVQMIKQELAHLHGTANQIYDQIRVILTTWQPLESVDLMTAVYDQALLSSNQEVFFQVKVSSNGPARALPSYLSRKILGISREAIVNVRKHAQSDLLEIHLDWTNDQLTLIIQDNGLGFDDQNLPNDGSHYGLKIMQERAEEINGRLTIQSSRRQGTTIRLNLPLPFVETQT